MTALETTCEVLEHLAFLGDAFADAVAAGDEKRVQLVVNDARKTRAELARAQAQMESEADAVDRDQHQRLAQAVRGAHIGNEMLRAWFERSLPDDDALLESPAGRRALADRMLGPIWDPERDVVAILGRAPGLAMAFRELGQKRILVLATEDPQSVRGATKVEADDLQTVVGSYAKDKPERFQIFCVDPELEEETQARLRRTISTTIQFDSVLHSTLAAHGENAANNLIENIPAIAGRPSISSLAGIARGETVVIVSPGPSLDKNIEALAHIQKEVVVICVSHALGALDRHGIVPDIVVACDMEDLGYHFDVDITKDAGLIVLAACCHPAAFQTAHPRILTTGLGLPAEMWLGRFSSNHFNYSVGGSVSHAAFRIAQLLEAERIVLVGQDLAFSDGRVYADGHDGDTVLRLEGDRASIGGWSAGYAAMDSVDGASESEVELETVRGYYGGTARTSETFKLFLQWFEIIAPSVDAQLINATEGGAFIEGFEHAPLKSVAGSDSARSAKARLRQEFPAAFDRSRMLSALRSLLSLQAKCKRLALQAQQSRNANTRKKLVAATKKNPLLQMLPPQSSPKETATACAAFVPIIRASIDALNRESDRD